MFQPLKYAPGDYDNAPDGAVKINANFRELYGTTSRISLLRNVELFFVGDSLSVQNAELTDRSAAWWAMAFYNLAVTIKQRGKRGKGTSVSGEAGGNGPEFGMTNKARMDADAVAIAASAREGYSPVAVMSVQTNDAYASDNGQNGQISTVANVEKWFLEMLPAGLTHLVINGGGPSATGGANALRTRGICNAYRALARKYRGLITFVDNSTILASNTIAYTADGGQGAVGSTLYDDLHPSGHGSYRMGKYTLGPALLRLCGERDRLVGWIGDKYDQDLNSRGPLMGGATRYGGYNVPIAAGVESGTFRIVQSDVSDPIQAALGRPDITARLLRLSGIPDTAGRLTSTRTVNNPAGFDPTLIPFMPEANAWFDVTNIRAPAFGWVSGGVGGQARQAIENPSADIIPRLKGLMTFYAGDIILESANYKNRSSTFSFGWDAGLEVAGDIILISGSDYPQPPLPAASA